MPPHNLFLLAVRLLGLVLLYHGLAALPTTRLSAFVTLFGRSFLGFLGMSFMALWPLLLAFWLIQGAPFVMRLAYPANLLRAEANYLPSNLP
jgi:hypothetical protein